MLKNIWTPSLLVLAMAGAPAAAQTGGPPADQAPAGSGASPLASPSDVPMGGKTPVKTLVAGCRANAKSQGLKAEAFLTAVDQCVAAQRPKVAARMGCRQRGRKQGLAGTKLKEFINTCASLPQT